ncbi:MAG: pantoate--beta-alanine ligase, partial [Actinomycetota bacterium]|nr:pantoate--beta-alanine ligase [Actinomycetota bacterium]
ALSSRNVYLSPADRRAALALSRALQAGTAQAAAGPKAVRHAAEAVAVAEAGVAVDYVVLVDPQTLRDVADDFVGEGLLALAARVGSTRLIDNQVVQFGERGPA